MTQSYRFKNYQIKNLNTGYIFKTVYHGYEAACKAWVERRDYDPFYTYILIDVDNHH